MAALDCDCESPVFRPRKSHTKSRNGCLSCKQQRRKCDEARPTCLRCRKRKTSCRYDTGSGRQCSFLIRTQSHHEPTRRDLLAARGAGWPKASTILAAGLPPCLSEACTDGTSLADTLAATELDLLARYLTHTSHIIPVDEVDVFALQIGIPSLAFGSVPLMDTMLALAAVCQCHAILNMPDIDRREWQQLDYLLALANHHYSSSLHKIQGLSSIEAEYDNVLANATIMVLYGAASHSLWVRIAKSPHKTLASNFPSTPLQWMLLIRAADLAYRSLLNCRADSGGGPVRDELPVRSRQSGWPAAIPASPTGGLEDGPTAQTRMLIQPMIAATAAKALESLECRLQEAMICLGEDTTWGNSVQPLHSCYEAFEALQDIVHIIIVRPRRSREVEETRYVALPPQSGLFAVSPWLRTYVAQVTSAVPQKQLRRIVMSFLNRVPLEFLDLVQESLEDDSMQRQHATPALRLALDIFAHWLVLVTLLDGVWWIDGIGEWELDRAVSRFNQILPSKDELDEWWPEKMLMVRRELLGGERFVDGLEV